MPRVRINLDELDDLDNLDDLEQIEEQADQEKRIRTRDRTDRRKPVTPQARARRIEDRRRGKEYARIQRERHAGT